MNRATEQKLEAIVEALTVACGPNGKDVRTALVDLVNFKPEDTPKPIPGCGITRAEMKAAPFFCETFLYGLLGKEDARSLLIRVRRLCAELGVELDRLYADEPR